MIDREALTAALKTFIGFDDWMKAKTSPNSVEEIQLAEAMRVLATTASERLARVPEKCGACGGGGVIVDVVAPHIHQTCPACLGRGTVYEPETVERIGESMRSTLAQIVSVELEPSQFVTALDELAVAVLDALNTESL